MSAIYLSFIINAVRDLNKSLEDPLKTYNYIIKSIKIQIVYINNKL